MIEEPVIYQSTYVRSEDDVSIKSLHAKFEYFRNLILECFNKIIINNLKKMDSYTEFNIRIKDENN